MAARTAAVFLAALVLAAPAAARRGPVPVTGKLPPEGLKAFLLRVDDQAGHTFSRTPSFAWSPVAGALKYEFELASSKRFSENGIIYSNTELKSPVASIPISLPWSTGDSYSLFAHVRAVTRAGATAWSVPYGFAMRWTNIPKPLEPSYPGLVRWTPVSGANAYIVWFPDANRSFTTLTNAADEREFYTFHQGASWTSSVRWRIRAIRWLYGQSENGLPPVSYGPWSPIYTSYNPPFAIGPLTTNGTVSESTVVSNALEPKPHALMPAFLFSGNQGIYGQTEELYHVYVFTDRDCLNMVYRSAIVGSPAYAPRPTGPLALPTDAVGIDGARLTYPRTGDEGQVYTYEHLRVVSSEATPGGSPAADGQSSTGGPGAAGSSLPVTQIVNGAKVDLWDTDWPTGRYYWTAIPVQPAESQGVFTTLTQPAPAGSTFLHVGATSMFAPGDVLRVGTPPASEDVTVQAVAGTTITLAAGVKAFHATGTQIGIPAGTIEYRDTELTQDACASGRVLTFGKTSEPVVTGEVAPYISGLSPKGKLFSAKRSRPAVYGIPLVTWQPALGADYYEVQWSKRLDPFTKVGSTQTAGTAVTLPLSVGLWYYRVRGLNTSVPGNKPQMAWSDPVAVQIAKPTFRVVRH